MFLINLSERQVHLFSNKERLKQNCTQKIENNFRGNMKLCIKVLYNIKNNKKSKGEGVGGGAKFEPKTLSQVIKKKIEKKKLTKTGLEHTTFG